MSLLLFLALQAAGTAAPSAPPDPDTIIVTGERMERDLLSTSSSVAVTTRGDLDAFAGPDTLAQVIAQTANVTASGAGNQGPTIRGANTSGVLTSLESFFGGAQPRTTVQVDGRQLTFGEFVYGAQSVWDVERVEVFRGPQTTTQGRNAIAGAIFVETANPSHDAFEGRARVIGGTNDARQVSAALSGPLGNGQLAFHLSGDWRRQDGFVEPVGLTEDIGADPREVEATNVRGKLSLRPANVPALSALLTVSHSDTSRPQTDSVDRPFEAFERVNPQFSVFETSGDAAILDLAYEASERFAIMATGTASRGDAERLAPLGTGNAEINTEELTGEVIANLGSATDRLNGLVGIYASTLETEETLNLDAFGIGIGAFSDDRTSVGLFGEATYSPNGRLHLTAGGRYQRDEQDRQGGFADVIPIDFDESFGAFLPRAEVAYDVSNGVRIGVLAERGYNAGGFTFNFDTFAAERFAEETLWNYEAFARYETMGGRLLVSANAFYNDIEDLQVVSLVEVADDFFAQSFSNAGEARAIGGELEARLRASKAVYLRGGVGVTDTKIESDADSGALLEGNEFQRAPTLTATGGIVWTPTEALQLSAFGRYSDGYYSDEANTPVNEVDDYATLDLQASYRLGAGRLFLDVTNATDTFYEVVIFDGGNLASVGEPRRAEIGFEVSF